MRSSLKHNDYMWVHIRGVGQWTNRLYAYFEREQERLHSGEVTAHNLADTSAQTILPANAEKPSIKMLPPSSEKMFPGNQRSPFGNGINKKKSFEFSPSSYSNEAFTIDEGKVANSDPDIRASRKLTPEKKLQMLLFQQKAPLEKALSMPDMQNKLKKRERMMALREYMRSESEKSFDECQMRRAHMKALGLAYLSPQNRSLAQSFRYMRNKPTIIAFKTPSVENCEKRGSTGSIISLTRRRLSKTPEKDVESAVSVNNANQSWNKNEQPNATPDKTYVNYPVGKPLEMQKEYTKHISQKDYVQYLKAHSPEQMPRADMPVLGAGMEIYLDGPYGAPSSHIFRAQHAVLIGTGIGVTPFASILQSIMHRYWKARHCCPKCTYTWASDIPPTIMHLRKVDFFWINRDQRSFEWFVSLLSQLEIEQAELGGAMERFLEMHMYITSALQRTDMKAVGLQLALDLLHEKEKRDLITGLKTRTIAGRPNWDKVFKQVQEQRKGKVTVFYCGPPQLARLLRVKCDLFGFSFRKEIF